MRYLVPVIIPIYLLWCGEIVALPFWQRNRRTDLKASLGRNQELICKYRTVSAGRNRIQDLCEVLNERLVPRRIVRIVQVSTILKKNRKPLQVVSRLI